MHDEHLGVDAVGQRQPVVDLREELDHLRVVLCLDLSLEAVHLVHVLALVVAAGHEERVGVEQLEAEQGEDTLNGEGASVRKVLKFSGCHFCN